MKSEHPCANCRFYAQSVWQPVAGCTVSTLTRSFTRRELDTGSVLYHQGVSSDGVYCGSCGLMAIRSFGLDRASSLLRLAYPGELIGYRAFLINRDPELKRKHCCRRGFAWLHSAMQNKLSKLAQP
jgi:hypothetical protein